MPNVPDPPRAWTVVASRTVFEHERLVLVEDTVRLPSGRQSSWLWQASARDFVIVICLDADDQVLVAYQYCHPARTVVDEFPGGTIEPGETAVDAARRELMEEVGLYPHRLAGIGSFLPDNRRKACRAHVFVATDLEPRRLPGDAEEFISFEWLPQTVVEARIRSGVLANGVLLAAWSLFRLAPATVGQRPGAGSDRKQAES